MSQENLGKGSSAPGSDLSKWRIHRNKLPVEMRELEEYEDNSGYAEGHFLPS